MMFTPADHLGAVSRALSTTTRDGQELRLLTVTRTYDATPDEVWDALTGAERIPRWLTPITGDLQVGGTYQLEGNAGGEILGCTPPERLSVSWVYGDQPSWVDVTLSPDGDRTRLVLEHAAPVDVGVEHWEQFGPGATGIGWELALMGLAEHLADPSFLSPAPDQAPDPGILEYMAASSATWGEVHASSGADPEQARAAAERCRAAYTGAPEPGAEG